MDRPSENSSLPFEGVNYCTRCCVPSTQEGVEFDELGICTACQSSEQKMHIDWSAREGKLREILEGAKASAGDGYDCVLPISGGKDSFFQAHVLINVYKMKPLAVTFNQNWVTETGFYNLQRCLQVFDLDHMQFTPARRVVNKLARKSLDAIGDACWHCHAGVGAFPMQVATNFKIPLLIWGESTAETSGRASYHKPQKFDRDYFTKVSAKKTPAEMVDDRITLRDVHPFQLPSYEEIEKTGVWGLHLGDYMFWDDERQTEFIREEYGWRETEMEGAMKGYKSVECVMSGVHDHTCYKKRGFGRTTWQAAVDVRKGLLTRAEGFELVRQYDQERPEALDYYLEITKLDENEFNKIINSQKHEALSGIDLPVNPKKHKNAEKLVPFVEQVIEKHLGRPDVRVARDEAEVKRQQPPATKIN